MFHMAPTTFQGISSGRAISTRQTETHGPLRGMVSAMATPSGISMARMLAVKIACRPRLAWKRSDCRMSWNQTSPAQKNSLFPKVSWNA